MKIQLAKAFLLSQTALGLALLASGAVNAQTAGNAAPTNAAPTATAPDTQAITDIVITARKTQEKLQDVPIAVTAIGGAALKEKTIQGVQDIQFHVPGFVEYPEAQGGAPDFAIRGAKQQGVSGSQGGVAVYLDYVPLSSNYSIATSTYDMQSVQVLKGPQGTLFGKNTTGGAIIFSPNKPGNRFEGSLTGEYGNYNRVDLTGVVNVPIGQGVGLRLAGRYIHRDPYIVNIGSAGGGADSENNQSFRASLRIQPGTTFTNDTVFDYYHQNQHPNTDRTTGYNAPFLCHIYPSDCTNGVSKSFMEALSLPLRKADYGNDANVNRGTYWGLSNTTTFAPSDLFSIRNIFGYRHDKLDSLEENDGTALPILEGTNHNHQRQVTDEVDFIGKLFDERLSYTAGFYYADNKYTQVSLYRIFAPVGTIFGEFAPGGGGLPQFPIVIPGVVNFSPIAPSDQYNVFGTKSKAVFGQINYKITDQLTLTAGARYNQDKVSFNSQQYQGYTDMTQTAPRCNIAAYAVPSELVGPCEVARATKFNSFTWNASLNFKPDSQTLIYVSAGRGFQAGGFNQQIKEAQYRTFKPEKVFNIEAGIKKDWMLGGRPVRTNAAIFRASYKDQQRVENGTYADGLNYIATFNAANSTMWGGELEVNYIPVRNLDLSLSYSYINAHYDTFMSPAVGTSVSTDLSGLAIAATPKHTVNGTISYSVPVNSADGHLRFSLSGYYRSGVYFNDLAQDAANYQKGYALLNGRIDLLKALPVDVGVWMNNITNKKYGVFKFNNLNTLSYTAIFLGAPRTFGVDVSVHF